MSVDIRIRDLKFSYFEAHPILHIPSLDIKAGEFIFLYGPSGSGKSTLLELLAGVLKSSTGELSIGAFDLCKLSISQLDHFRAENIGYIFQNFNLIPYLSVSENIQLPSLFQKELSTPEEIQSLVSQLGLWDHLNKPVSQLSVGQQQRVAVARALVKKPKLILADEPTSALDYNHREKFLKLLFELCKKQGTTVLFVSHDLSMEKLFDRSLSLESVNLIKSQLKEQDL
jgi:putative ABC transport system ATP-binding protein